MLLDIVEKLGCLFSPGLLCLIVIKVLAERRVFSHVGGCDQAILDGLQAEVALAILERRDVRVVDQDSQHCRAFFGFIHQGAILRIHGLIALVPYGDDCLGKRFLGIFLGEHIFKYAFVTTVLFGQFGNWLALTVSSYPCRSFSSVYSLASGNDVGPGDQVAGPAFVLHLALPLSALDLLQYPVSFGYPAIGGNEVTFVLHSFRSVADKVLVNIVGIDQ